MQTFLLLTLALLAFAGNSFLNRLALEGEHISVLTFTIVRLTSGFFILQLILLWRTGRLRRPQLSHHLTFRMPVALLMYGFCFSVAYQHLDTGTGALILFGVVQVLLLGLNYFDGHKMSKSDWAGALIASVGLVVLLLPGASAPDPGGALFMVVAGGAWGMYTYWGRGSKNPLEDTADNFSLTLPFTLLAGYYVVFHVPGFTMPTVKGTALAVISGTITTGIGYAIWYTVLPKLSILQSALSQLLVPVIAAALGMVFLGEQLTTLFVVSSALILGGILLVQLSKRHGSGDYV